MESGNSQASPPPSQFVQRQGVFLEHSIPSIHAESCLCLGHSVYDLPRVPGQLLVIGQAVILSSPRIQALGCAVIIPSSLISTRDSWRQVTYMFRQAMTYHIEHQLFG